MSNQSIPISENIKTIERFWAKVQKTEGGCWIWIGSKNGDGYGTFSVPKVGIKGAHRVSWEIHFGPIPFGNVLHNCPDGDNPACVNPSHLWLGTQDENVKDMEKKGRSYHPYGEKHGRAKLSRNDVEVIRNLYSLGGHTFASLSKIYGVSDTQIGWIVKFKSWKK